MTAVARQQSKKGLIPVVRLSAIGKQCSQQFNMKYEPHLINLEGSSSITKYYAIVSSDDIIKEIHWAKN